MAAVADHTESNAKFPSAGAQPHYNLYRLGKFTYLGFGLLSNRALTPMYDAPWGGNCISSGLGVYAPRAMDRQIYIYIVIKNTVNQHDAYISAPAPHTLEDRRTSWR